MYGPPFRFDSSNYYGKITVIMMGQYMMKSASKKEAEH
jgi:hypothetical protein